MGLSDTVGGLRAHTLEVPLADLRWPGAIMLAAGLVRPLVGNPGIPCGIRALTGIPCPLCGMTTSVTETVWLDVRSAMSANPMGVVAVVVAVLLLVFRRRVERVQHVAVPFVLVPITLAGMWVFELFRFDVL